MPFGVVVKYRRNPNGGVVNKINYPVVLFNFVLIESSSDVAGSVHVRRCTHCWRQ